MPRPTTSRTTSRYTPGMGFRVGSVLDGVPVFVSPSYFVVLLFIAQSTAVVAHSTARGPDELGLIVALVFAGTIFLHELGHAAVARALRLPVQCIRLVWFAGLTDVGEPPTPRAQYLVAAAGPAVSTLLTALLAVIAALVAGGPAEFVLASSAWLCGSVSAFNLLPGLPLDGGQVLRAGLWALLRSETRATRGAAIAGLTVAVLVAIGALALMQSGEQGSGLWLLVVALFLGVNARAAVRRSRVDEILPSLAARDLARAPLLTVEPSLPLAEALRRAGEVGARAILVGRAGEAAEALVSPPAVDAIPAEKRPWVAVASAARPLAAVPTLGAALSGRPLLDTLRRKPAPEYVVLGSDDTIVGVLLTSDVDSALRAATGRHAR